MQLIKQWDGYNNTTRDAVYHVGLVQNADNYDVLIAYGSRGASLKPTIKAKGLALDLAEKEFNKAVKAKQSNAYNPHPGISGNGVFAMYGTLPVSGDGQDIAGLTTEANQSAVEVVPAFQRWEGTCPMLLNEIEKDDAEKYLTDDSWGLMEKMDGERRMASITKSSNGEVVGVNKKGNVTYVPEATATTLKGLNSTIHIDGEEIGSTVHCFNLLEISGIDYSGRQFIDAYKKMCALLEGKTGNGIDIVPLFLGTEEKRKALLDIKAKGGEGVVFIRLASSYREGRPNSGGDILKYKFKKSASCVVSGSRDGKRSVAISLVNENGALSSVGNVTIPPNMEIPNTDDIVEVEYLYVKFRGGNLFQPVYKGKRNDVSREDCVFGQLKYKGEGCED